MIRLFIALIAALPFLVIAVAIFSKNVQAQDAPPYVYIVQGSGVEIPQRSIRKIEVRVVNLKSRLNRPDLFHPEPDYEVRVTLGSGLTLSGDCTSPVSTASLGVPKLRDEHTFGLDIMGCTMGTSTISAMLYVDSGSGDQRAHELPDPRTPSLTPTPWPRYATGDPAESITQVSVTAPVGVDIDQHANFFAGVAGRHIYFSELTLYREPFPTTLIPGITSALQGNADITLTILGPSIRDVTPAGSFARSDGGFLHEVVRYGIPEVRAHREAIAMSAGDIMTLSNPQYNAVVYDLNELDKLHLIPPTGTKSDHFDPNESDEISWRFEGLQWRWVYDHPWDVGVKWALNGLSEAPRDLFMREWPEFTAEPITLEDRGPLSGLTLSETENICAVEPETRLEKITITSERVGGTVVWECPLHDERPKVRAEAAVDDYLLVDRSPEGDTSLYASIRVDSELDESLLTGKMGAKARSYKPGMSAPDWGVIPLNINMVRDSSVPTAAEPIIRFTGSFSSVPLRAEVWRGYETPLYEHDLRVEVEMEYTLAIYYDDRDIGDSGLSGSIEVDMRGLPNFKTTDYPDFTLHYIESYSCPCAEARPSFGSVSWSGSVTCVRGDGTSYSESYSGSRRVMTGCNVYDPPPTDVRGSHLDQVIRIEEDLRPAGTYETYVVKRKHTMATALSADYKAPNPTVITGSYPLGPTAPRPPSPEYDGRWWWSSDG